MPRFEKLETSRLIIRRFRENDVPPLVAYRADPKVYRYLPWNSYDEAKAKALIERIKDKEPGEPGGYFLPSRIKQQVNLLVIYS